MTSNKPRNNSPLDNKTRERSKREHMICKYGGNESVLYEAILVNNTPYFLNIVSEEVSLTESIELDDILLVPPNKTNYLSKEYSFTSLDEIKTYAKRANKENMYSLYKKIKKVWKKYLDIDEDSIVLCSADTLFTYFQDRLGMTHYLLFVGDNSSGKSNGLRIFLNLGYRPMFDTSITPANIYNFLDRIEEGQGIILEDEIDNIEDQEEKMRIYKGGYVSGTQVTRIYESPDNSKSAKRQQRYFTYCFKAFSSEKYPSYYKAKGFNERLLTINCSPGNPQYDITEILNDSGDIKYKKLHNELIDLRKLLLIFRIQNYNKAIPDLQISLRNREKQLCKPILRLFQGTNCLNEILRSLSKFLLEKKNKKLNSLDSYLYSIILDLTNSGNLEISNETLWNFVLSLPGSTVLNKPQSYYTEEFGTISKGIVTKICEDKFGATRSHDGQKRYLVFDKKTIENLKDNYSSSRNIVILGDATSNTNTANTFNTFWKGVERKGSLKIGVNDCNQQKKIIFSE